MMGKVSVPTISVEISVAAALYKLCDNGRLVYVTRDGGVAVVLDQPECNPKEPLDTALKDE